jgi:hypothetical protein
MMATRATGRFARTSLIAATIMDGFAFCLPHEPHFLQLWFCLPLLRLEKMRTLVSVHGRVWDGASKI